MLYSHFLSFQSIMKRPATFLFFFSVPRRISVVKTRKFKKKIFGQKLKKKLGVPLDFFQFLAKKFLFEFSGFYDRFSSRDTKKE